MPSELVPSANEGPGVLEFVFPVTGDRIRTVQIDGDTWFVAADVCAALGIANPPDAIKRLDDDEYQQVGAALVSTEGRPQDRINVVCESGLYSLVLGSRKPEVKAFKRWITR